MKAKAMANLEASRRLMRVGLPDPAMSRLYYALFQAGIEAMHRLGKSPADFTRSATQWTHAAICGNSALFQQLTRLPRVSFLRARSLREQADYHPQPVDPAQVEDLLPKVAAFVERACS